MNNALGVSKEKGIDSFKLKLIALFFMILDHLHTHLWFYATWPQWLSIVTRFVSPLFLYLMIEGFYHTRSRKKYLIRLFTAAFIMMGGNIAINLFFHNVSSATGKYTYFSLTGPNNIFLTLALLFSMVWCMENVKNGKNRIPNVLLALLIAFLCMFAEGGVFMLPIAVITWLFREKKTMKCIFIGAFCAVLLAYTLISYTGGSTLYSYLCFDNEWAMCLVIPFILAYNGKRGINCAFSKYMFYVIYPIHLWILMFLNFMFD